MDFSLLVYLCFYHKNMITMNKGTHFLGQPMYGLLISLLDKAQIFRISQENGGERYVKHFDVWQHYFSLDRTILWKSMKKQGKEKRIGDVLRDSGALPERDSGAKKEKGVAHGATPLESGWTS